ncbi:MAG: LUD domain-containing protein [Rubrivivax sp.]|nr:LUD domain-containing protein [Rubrivivax sp.]
MSTRDELLGRIRRSQPAARPLPPLPEFEAPPPSVAAFRAALERMGGHWAELPAGGRLASHVAALFPDAQVVCSATDEVRGRRALDPALPPASLADVDVGVVRAALGVAETGSVLLTESQLVVEAIGFLPQHLLVLLDPARIVPTLHQAYCDPAFGLARYAVFLTGPSATADIEGVLIHGAQGVRSLTVVPLAEVPSRPGSGTGAA